MYGSVRCSTQAIRNEVYLNPPPSAEDVMMVPPTSFEYNQETAQNNAFMKMKKGGSVRDQAMKEFQNLTKALTAEGVKVHEFPNTLPNTPDACFPNNWFSTHVIGDKRHLILYPMYAKSRRIERFEPTIKELKKMSEVVIDLTHYENQENPLFLESTGSLVLDRVNRVGYLALSERSSAVVGRKWAELLDYRLVEFSSTCDGYPIYHTNVMMAVGEKWAMICQETIESEDERMRVINSLVSTGHEVIYASLDQMRNFACNIIELRGNHGKVVAMSATARKSLTTFQVNQLEKYAKIVASDIGVIEEIGGGSVRCMIGELFYRH